MAGVAARHVGLERGGPGARRPTGPLVGATEQARAVAGAHAREITLTAARATIRVGGRRVKTWAFNSSVPGPEIRVNAIDLIKATVHNKLPQALTILGSAYGAARLARAPERHGDVARYPSHGHTFQAINNGGRAGARKDIVIIEPKSRVTDEFVADNPGRWALHRHNFYHAEPGMVTVLSYVK